MSGGSGNLSSVLSKGANLSQRARQLKTLSTQNQSRAVPNIYVDGDARPVRDEVYRVAERLNLQVFVVSNGSRPIRPPGRPNVSLITVAVGADAADDWIAERITGTDVCVTADIPLAARCLAKGARAVSPTGKHWTADNIGMALAGREIARYRREIGLNTCGPPPLTCADRSRFLGALDAAIRAAQRANVLPPTPELRGT